MSTLVKPTPPEKRERGFTPKIKLPRDRYSIRFTAESFEFSQQKADGSGNNPMIVVDSEIVAPDEFTAFDGSKVSISGVSLRKLYFTLQVKNTDGTIDSERSQKAIDRYYDLLTKMQIPHPEEGIDVENPPKLLTGKVASAICDAEESVQRQDPTPEQRAKKELGTPIKDEEGHEVKAYWPFIVEILGRSSVDVSNKPF